MARYAQNEQLMYNKVPLTGTTGRVSREDGSRLTGRRSTVPLHTQLTEVRVPGLLTGMNSHYL